MHATTLSTHPIDSDFSERVKTYVLDSTFPYVGARSAINSKRAVFGSFGSLGNDEPVRLRALCKALAVFSGVYLSPREVPVTYIALFDEDVNNGEDFERRLWRHLQLLQCINKYDFG